MNPRTPVIILLLLVLPPAVRAQHLFVAKEKGSQWGFIDTTGVYVIAPQFDYAYPFHEKLAVVQQKKKWGVIDIKGKFVIPPAYDDAQGIVQESKATVKKGKTWGVVALDGHAVIPFAYDYASVFHEGYVVLVRHVKKKTGTVYDIAIARADGSLALDFGSYQLPGQITNGKDWSLGKWPLVRDGFITLLYDHSFDIDVTETLDRKFNYLMFHHVASGFPAQHVMELEPGAPITEYPYFSGGVALTVIDRGQADTVRADAWQAGQYYTGDLVTYRGTLYEALADLNDRQTPEANNNWKARGNPIVPRYGLTVYEPIPNKNYILDGELETPWDWAVVYFSMERVAKDGWIFRSQQDDNKDKNPWNSPDYWVRERPVVDSLGVRYYRTCPTREMSGSWIKKISSTISLVMMDDERVFLIDGGWYYPFPSGHYTYADATIGDGLMGVRLKDSGKFGYVNLRGGVVVPFSFDAGESFREGAAAIKKDGKYGLVRNDGNVLVPARFEFLSGGCGSLDSGY